MAVTHNSRLVSKEDKAIYEDIEGPWIEVAALLQCTAPIRFDIRQPSDDGPFALFDINMKPVSQRKPLMSPLQFSDTCRT